MKNTRKIALTVLLVVFGVLPSFSQYKMVITKNDGTAIDYWVNDIENISWSYYNHNETVKENFDSLFYAVIESNNETRSAIESNNIIWKGGDQVSVFAGKTTNNMYQISGEDDGKTSGKLVKTRIDTSNVGKMIPDNVAYYPYNENNRIEWSNDKYRVFVNFPEDQYYDSFIMPMYGISSNIDDNTINFKGLASVLRLGLKGGCKVRTIVISGNNGEVLSGSSVIEKNDNGELNMLLDESGNKSITLNCDDIQLNNEAETTFDIVVPDVTFVKGFKIVITDSEGKIMKKSSKNEISIGNRKIYKMSSIYVKTDYEFVDLNLPSGNLWAKMNLGAESDTELGTRYAWGELETKEYFYWSNYKGYSYKAGWSETNRIDNDGFPLPDINHPAEYTYPDYGVEICGTENDVALNTLGGYWHIPSDVDIKELMTYCNWENTTKYGVKGYKVTSISNKNWIFIPEGEIWSSTSWNTRKAKMFNGQYISTTDKRDGLYIRPVKNDKVTKIALVTKGVVGKIGEKVQIDAYCSPANAKNINLEIVSNNEEIAIVDQSGSIELLKAGITSVLVINETDTAECLVEIYDSSYFNYHYVDLGLSVKWATCNVGGVSCLDKGEYYSWGETEPKTIYGYDNNGKKGKLSKKEDVAQVIWGG